MATEQLLQLGDVGSGKQCKGMGYIYFSLDDTVCCMHQLVKSKQG